MASAYLQKLLDLRQRWDVLPWIEVESTTLPDSAAVGQQAVFTVSPSSYHIVVRDMPFWALGLNGNGFVALDNLSNEDGDFLWSLGLGASAKRQASLALSTNRVLGRYDDEWIAEPAGLLIPKGEAISGVFTLTSLNPSVNPDTNIQLWWGMRGYRLFPRGSAHRQMRTREEWIRAGHTLDHFQHVVRPKVDLTQNSNPTTITETLSEDFLVESIRIGTSSPQVFPGSGGYADGVMVKMTTSQGLQFTNDWVPYTMIEGGTMRTRWVLPFPLSMKSGEQWTVSLMPQYPKAGLQPQTFEVALDGEIIN